MPDDTKERIVIGAYRALVRDGYNRTTVKDIANEAGVASGLVHYYFHTKEELLVAAIDHACAENMQDQRVGDIHDPLEAARTGIESEKRLLHSAPDLYRLIFDMFGVGLHNPAIATAVRRYMSERRELIVAIGEALLAQAPSRPTMPIDAISSAIWGSFIGISLQKLVEPEFDSDAALDALADMVFTYLPISLGQQVG